MNHKAHEFIAFFIGVWQCCCWASVIFLGEDQWWSKMQSHQRVHLWSLQVHLRSGQLSLACRSRLKAYSTQVPFWTAAFLWSSCFHSSFFPQPPPRAAFCCWSFTLSLPSSVVSPFQGCSCWWWCMWLKKTMTSRGSTIWQATKASYKYVYACHCLGKLHLNAFDMGRKRTLSNQRCKCLLYSWSSIRLSWCSNYSPVVWTVESVEARKKVVKDVCHRIVELIILVLP